MPPPPRHFKDEIQDLLDNRLDAQMRAEVERHLETCEECRREFEAMRWTRQLAATRVAAVSAPLELREKILGAVKTNTPEPGAQILQPRFRFPKLAPALAIAAVFLIAAVLAFIFLAGGSSPTAVVARDYRDYKTGKLRLDLKTGDVKQMEAFFATHGVSFSTRVFDLAMMNYRLLGGRVHHAHGAPSALFVYEESPGRILVCQMYPGKVTELPPGAVERQNKRVKFYVYTKKNLTMVFWQEGAIVCVLTSDIPSEQVIQLAFAKAMTL